MSERKRDAGRRTYRPVVEGLEALRLLANAAPAFADVLAGFEPATPVLDPLDFSGDAWDAALGRSRVADLIGDSGRETALDARSVDSGLRQLDRYLSRTWYRSGIDVQKHEDCTQAVYTALLQNFGRNRFDRMLSDVGQTGIREVFSRDTTDGPDFFRIVDAVKKRAQRERTFQPIDRIDLADMNPASGETMDRRGALRDAISQSLSPREAVLIHETLLGRTPAEIAQVWGVAPKTVSNEKARALQKLREVLVASPMD